MIRTTAAGCTLAALLSATTTTTATAQGHTFAEPVRLQAGDKFLGEGRSYPSPVAHDFNGDGRPDLFVGDLWGKITYALRQKVDGDPRFADEQALKDAAGKDLDFGNW